MIGFEQYRKVEKVGFDDTRRKPNTCSRPAPRTLELRERVTTVVVLREKLKFFDEMNDELKRFIMKWNELWTFCYGQA